MHWMFLPLRRYAEFSGRSRRLEYWMFGLGMFLLFLLLIVGIFIFAAVGVLGNRPSFDPAAPQVISNTLGAAVATVIVFLVAVFALLLPSIAVSVRRLHDINFSGHWVWIMWGPYLASAPLSISMPDVSLIFSSLTFLGWLALFVMAMIAGTRGPNRFGPDPKEGGEAEVFA